MKDGQATGIFMFIIALPFTIVLIIGGYLNLVDPTWWEWLLLIIYLEQTLSLAVRGMKDEPAPVEKVYKTMEGAKVYETDNPHEKMVEIDNQSFIIGQDAPGSKMEREGYGRYYVRKVKDGKISEEKTYADNQSGRFGKTLEQGLSSYIKNYLLGWRE